MTSKFFQTQDAYAGVTAMSGLVGELAFLVRGSERALLIDTLSGVGSLKSFCRELTDLPLTVVNTHGHVDHVGGNAEFGRCYIHPLDIAEDVLCYQATVAKKMDFILRECGVTLSERGMSNDDFVQEIPFYAIPVMDGECFDLGGKIIEIIHVPGHTSGSIALLDVEARVVFLGDCLGTGLTHENSTSVEDYLEALTYFKTHAHRFDRMIWSHNNLEHLTPARIDEVMEVCQEVLDGKDDAMPCLTDDIRCAKKIDKTGRRLDGKWANLRYHKAHIYKHEKRSKSR